MKQFRVFALAVLFSFPAYPADRKAENSAITSQQADAILNELRQIRQLLEKQGTAARAAAAPAPAPAATKAKITIGDAPVLGAKTAPLTLIEFTDYQCAFCRQFHLNTFGEIRKKYIDTGKVRFVSHDLPLDMHPNAPRAAEAARCAGEQGQFWTMRDILITHADKLSAEDLVGYAQSLQPSLDLASFRSCLDSGKYKQAVQKDASEAASLNVSGTPTFLIGKSTENGADGIIFVGAQPLAAFEAKFNELNGER